MAVVNVFAMFGLIALGGQARRLLLAIALAASLATAAVMVTTSQDSTTFGRYSSIAPSNASSTIYDSRSSTWSLTPLYIREIPFGAGLGSVGPAATKAGGVGTTWNAESEFNFLIVEAGVAGLVVFLGFQAALFKTIFVGLRRERDDQAVVLLAGLSAPLFGFAASCFFGTTTAQPPDAPFIWLSAGMVSWWLITRQQSSH
jgi:hypothetical protein